MDDVILHIIRELVSDRVNSISEEIVPAGGGVGELMLRRYTLDVLIDPETYAPAKQKKRKPKEKP